MDKISLRSPSSDRQENSSAFANKIKKEKLFSGRNVEHYAISLWDKFVLWLNNNGWWNLEDSFFQNLRKEYKQQTLPQLAELFGAKNFTEQGKLENLIIKSKTYQSNVKIYKQLDENDLREIFSEIISSLSVSENVKYSENAIRLAIIAYEKQLNDFPRYEHILADLRMQLIELNKANASDYFALGTYYLYQKKDREKAFQYLNKSIIAGNINVNVIREVARSLQNAKQNTFASIYNSYANSLEKAGDSKQQEAAFKAFQKALFALNLNIKEASNYELLEACNSYQKGIGGLAKDKKIISIIIEELIERDAKEGIKNAEYYLLLGQYYLDKNDKSKAENFFYKAIEIQPNNIKIISQIYDLYDDLNLKDEPFLQKILLLTSTAIILSPSALSNGKSLHIDDFQKFSIFPIANSFETNKQAILDTINTLSEDQKITAQARFNELKELIEYTRLMQKDKWKDIEKIVYYRLALRSNGIVAMMAKKLTIKGKVEMGVLVDENGKKYDNLRGKNSLIVALANYMKTVGANYVLIQYYLQETTLNSWSNVSQAMKIHMIDCRTVPEDDYFWKNGIQNARQAHKVLLDNIIRSDLGASNHQEAKLMLSKTWQIYRAFMMELLTNMDIPGKNAEEKTMLCYRTESKTVLEDINNCTETQDPQFKYKIKKGAMESYSIMAPVNVFGDCLTVQKIPFHRIFTTFLTESNPGSGQPSFHNNWQKEFVCMNTKGDDDTNDPPFWYAGTSKKYSGTRSLF